MEHLVGTFDSARAEEIRNQIKALPGNEQAFDGIEPSGVLVDLNTYEMNLTGQVPTDVLQAMFSGRLQAGLPQEYYNPSAGERSPLNAVA